MQVHPFFNPPQIVRELIHSDYAPDQPSFNAELIITSNHAATHVDAFGHYDRTGGAAAIAETAQDQYGVTFPMAAKVAVTGANAHPFYKWAAEARPKDTPRWNFHKYLIGRDGYIADVFPSAVEPTDTRIKTALGRALAVS